MIPLAGDGGRITLITHNLLVRDGGEIDSSTLAGGASGNIIIDASRVDISGQSGGMTSQIEVTSAGSGSAGDVEISADTLLLRDGGEINVSGGLPNILFQAPDAGSAGTLLVDANTIRLDNGSLSGKTTSNLGGGNLVLNANNIVLRSGSTISTEATGISRKSELNVAMEVS
ncbi:MAG: hypothetical protein WBA10_07595 [Elainellaceae cyanobacterium]